MTTAAELLAPALAASGMSRRALALATGSSEAGLNDVWHGKKDITVGRLDRLLQPLGHSLVSVPTHNRTVRQLSAQVRHFVTVGDDQACWRSVLQMSRELGDVDGATRVVLAFAPPSPTGSDRYDAFIAGVAEFELARDGLPLPSWLTLRTPASVPWDFEPVPALRSAARRVTPTPLAARNIFIDPENFDRG